MSIKEKLKLRYLEYKDNYNFMLNRKIEEGTNEHIEERIKHYRDLYIEIWSIVCDLYFNGDNDKSYEYLNDRGTKNE